MTSSRLAPLFACLGLALSASAQTPSPAPIVSPGAALRQAMRPFETTRNSMANWSGIEQAAYGVAVKQASAACIAAPASAFSRDDLLDEARLCGLGLDYLQAHAALQRFITTQPSSPRLIDAYALDVDATLHLRDKDAAVAEATHLLEQSAYTPLVSDAINEAIGYMETLFTTDALALATKRQPLILAHLAALQTAPAAPATTDLDRAALYRDGLRLASLQQLSNQIPAADATIRDLDAALGDALTPDETAAITAARTLYGLLNKPLPAIDSTHVLLPGKVPALDARGTATALLLFPDWCAQCIRMAKDMPQGVFWVEKHHARAFALLAETATPTPAAGKPAELSTDVFQPALAEQYLAATDTFTVAPSLLTNWGATDVPLLVFADSRGIVRYAAPADETAVQPGKTLDSLTTLIDKTWPATHMVSTPKPAPRAGSHASR